MEIAGDLAGKIVNQITDNDNSKDKDKGQHSHKQEF